MRNCANPNVTAARLTSSKTSSNCLKRKGAARNKLFEAFIKTGGDKDNILCSQESDYIQAYPNYEAYNSP